MSYDAGKNRSKRNNNVHCFLSYFASSSYHHWYAGRWKISFGHLAYISLYGWQQNSQGLKNYTDFTTSSNLRLEASSGIALVLKLSGLED